MSTPTNGLTTSVPGSMQSVRVANGGVVNGGLITNPLAASDQGLANAEVLYVDPVGTCAPVSGVLGAYGTIFALQPGQSWPLIAGQTTATYVNALSQGHRFSVVLY